MSNKLPHVQAHEAICKSIGDMAEENEALKKHVTELENRLRALWDKCDGDRNHYTDHIKRLESVTNDPHALWINWLRGSVALPVGIGDVREYQDRIKRLEDAGDELLRDNDDMANINRWHKAKEVKP